VHRNAALDQNAVSTKNAAAKDHPFTIFQVSL
jgi:hypothetical protein